MAITKISKAMMDANSLDSDSYVDGSIDNAHLAANSVDSDQYVDGSIDNAHLAANSVDSANYVDGSIDNAHIADDAIDSEHYAAGSIDEGHIADNAVTLAKMAGGTDGNIISFDASGNPVAIATGSDGQILTSTGAGSPPAFETAAGGGKVLQVVHTSLTSTVTMATGASWNDIAGLTVTTGSLASTSSRVYLQAVLSLKNHGDTTWFRLVDSSGGYLTNGVGDAASTRSRVSGQAGYRGGSALTLVSIVINIMDLPASTSAQTYKIQTFMASGTLYVNRSDTDSTSVNSPRSFSSITATEIGA